MQSASIAPLAVVASLIVGCGGTETKPKGASDVAPPGSAAASTPANGSKPPASSDLCAKTTCRPARTIELFADQNRSAKIDLPAIPYVVEDTIVLVTGDEIGIVAERSGERLGKLRVAKPGETAIKLQFRQERVGDKFAMMLTVTNPYDQHLRYRAGMQPVGRDEIHGTSTCPVLPGGRFGIESWPHPIAALHLRDFRLVDPKNTNELKCD